MKLTLKQQLIWLQLQGATYKECWYYLKQALTLHAVAPLNLTDCQGRLLHTQSAYNVLKNDCFKFYEDESLIESAITLSKKAILIGETIYPSALYHINKPPIILYYEGNVNLLKTPLVSMIGSRTTTKRGYEDATQLTLKLVDSGFTIVSGMARGIDAFCHTAALSVPQGQTIAIVASGLNTCYPREHLTLYEQLKAHQLVLSEYLPNEGIKKHHFIMRNRLVAGISPAVIVVEAAKHSGSLITANYALQFNKEVFVCPGHLSDEHSKGCLQLLNEGATPIYDTATFQSQLLQLYKIQGVIH